MNHYKRNSEAVWNIVDGEAVILNPETGMYYGLNTTATEIWNALEEPTTYEALLKHMKKTFDIEEKQLREDLTELIKDLTDKKLITQEIT